MHECSKGNTKSQTIMTQLPFMVAESEGSILRPPHNGDSEPVNMHSPTILTIHFPKIILVLSSHLLFIYQVAIFQKNSPQKFCMHSLSPSYQLHAQSLIALWASIS